MNGSTMQTNIGTELIAFESYFFRLYILDKYGAHGVVIVS
jgi:hypothetical protein